MYLEINGHIPLDSGHVYLLGKDLSRTKDSDDKFINLKDVVRVEYQYIRYIRDVIFFLVGSCG